MGEQRMSLSRGCCGCREATDLDAAESVLGFPGALLPDLAAALEKLAKKAIPGSRAKRAFQRLE